MAIRREQVILDLQDNLTGGLARAAVAAKLLDRELNSLGGTSVGAGRDLDKPAAGADKVGASSRKAGPEVDKLSGRMRIMADAALTLGPALIPIGASTIPVLTASLAGLGAAAGGIGVTVLALHGLGDAFKAMQTADLEPTAENLQAMRVEFEKAGPAAEHFLKHIDSITPELKNLQQIARSGMFPGVEDGIDDLLTRLPLFEKIVNRLSQEMGDLARDGGAALAGDQWRPFFDYVRREAAPTLDAFARSAGNVALGAANMLVAFEPLTNDFTGGLEGATKAFADWSAGLDDNDSFQSFLDYVRESGPQVVDLLGGLVAAFSGLAQAAAPWGAVVLPVLTGVAKAFGAISASPIGPGLYAAAAGVIAFNRASAIAEKSSSKISATWSKMNRETATLGAVGLMALSITDLDDKMGLANTSMGAMAGLMVGGPWGAAIGAAIGQYQDLNDATAEWTANVQKADAALQSGNVDQLTEQLANLEAQYANLTADVPDNPVDFLGTLLNPSKLQGNNEAMNAYADRISELKVALKEGGDVGDLFAESIGLTGDQLRAAAGDATTFSGALAELNGWFDRRDAVRAYKDSIDDLRKSLKNGFTREDASNLDAMGRSILQVSQSIKSPKVRANFLEGAREQLVDMAEHSGPKAAAAIQNLIDKFDDEGLTHPKITPTVDDSHAVPAVEKIKDKVKGEFDIMDGLSARPRVEADDSKTQLVIRRTNLSLDRMNTTTAKPKVQVDPGNSLSILDQLARMLGNLHDRTITVTTNHRGGVTSSAGGHSAPDDPTTPRRRPRMSPRLLDTTSGRVSGGLVGSTHTSRTSSGDRATDDVRNLGFAARDAATGLKGLKKQLEAQQKAYDKAKTSRDDALAQRDSISSSIQQGLGGDIWADVPAVGGIWGANSTPGGPATPASALAALNAQKARAQRLVAAINTLKAKGIAGSALLEIIGSGDVDRAEAMASLDVGSLTSFSATLNDTQTALAAAGLAGGTAVVGESVKATQNKLDAQIAELKEIKEAINQANNDNQTAAQTNAQQVAAGVNGAAWHGHRRGH